MTEKKNIIKKKYTKNVFEEKKYFKSNITKINFDVDYSVLSKTIFMLNMCIYYEYLNKNLKLLF